MSAAIGHDACSDVPYATATGNCSGYERLLDGADTARTNRGRRGIRMIARIGYFFATIAAAGVLAAGQGTFAQQQTMPVDNSPKPQHTPGGTAPGAGAHEHGAPPGETKDMQGKQNNMPGMPCCSPAPKK